MPNKVRPTLTPDQWESRDYRQTARDLDAWAHGQAGPSRDHDSTEYVAKLGLDGSASVVVMNRAHDRVLVPPPARAALAAFALAEEPFGFTHADLAAVRQAAASAADPGTATALGDLGDRLEALLSPAPGRSS